MLTAHGVTYFSTVPTMLSTLSEDVPSLRTIVLSGEVCPPELVTRWTRPGRRLLNVYRRRAACCFPEHLVSLIRN